MEENSTLGGVSSYRLKYEEQYILTNHGRFYWGRHRPLEITSEAVIMTLLEI
jgi:hypothetical protein